MGNYYCSMVVRGSLAYWQLVPACFKSWAGTGAEGNHNQLKSHASAYICRDADLSNLLGLVITIPSLMNAPTVKCEDDSI